MVAGPQEHLHAALCTSEKGLPFRLTDAAHHTRDRTGLRRGARRQGVSVSFASSSFKAQQQQPLAPPINKTRTRPSRRPPAINAGSS